jgi:hypothetical protein
VIGDAMSKEKAEKASKQVSPEAARPAVAEDDRRTALEVAAVPGRAPLDVAGERRVLDELHERREAQLHRKTELESERKTHAYAAHVQHDAEASKLLSRSIDDALRLDQHLASLDDAIAEQERVVARAEAEAALEADREQARALRKELIAFMLAGKRCHEALLAFATASAELAAARDRMQRLGCHYPSPEQLRVYGVLAVHTVLMQTPWREVGRHLASHEQKWFTKLVAEWSRAVERGIAARLGEAEPATKIESEVAA